MSSFCLATKVALCYKHLIFFSLYSGYSCRICSCTNTHPTHTTRTQSDLQLHADTKTASFLKSSKPPRLRRRQARRNPFVLPRDRGCRIFLGINPGERHESNPGFELTPAASTPGSASHPNPVRFSYKHLIGRMEKATVLVETMYASIHALC